MRSEYRPEEESFLSSDFFFSLSDDVAEEEDPFSPQPVRIEAAEKAVRAASARAIAFSFVFLNHNSKTLSYIFIYIN